MPLSALSAKKVRSLVRGRPLHSIGPKDNAAEAARLMREHNIGALVVMANDLLVGILSERDIVQRCVGAGKDPAKTLVDTIMSWPPITIDRNTGIGAAVVMMMEANIRHLPVMHGQKVLGMISIRQLVEEYRKGLERSILRIAA